MTLTDGPTCTLRGADLRPDFARPTLKTTEELGREPLEWRLIGGRRLTSEQALMCMGAVPYGRMAKTRLPVLRTTRPAAPAVLRDSCGRRRSAVTLPGHNKGVKPPNTGLKFPPDPPSDSDVQALMDACPAGSLVGLRNRSLIALLRGSGLRIHEALALTPDDLDFEHCTILVRRGKGGKRRRSGINRGALVEVGAWLHVRAVAGFSIEQPVFCVVEGPTRGGAMRSAYFRAALKELAKHAEVYCRVAPHSFRHAHALGLVRGDVSIPIVSRQLGHSNVAITSTYLQGISDDEVFNAVAGSEWQR